MALFRKNHKEVFIARYCSSCGGNVIVAQSSIGATDFDPLTGIPKKMELLFVCENNARMGCYAKRLSRDITPEEIEQWKIDKIMKAKRVEEELYAEFDKNAEIDSDK
jgi:hypothetical protein